MKFALVLALMSFNALAQTCFTRSAELQTTELTLAKTICVDDIKLNLDYFGNSTGTVKMSLDGRQVERQFSLNKGKLQADGSRSYEVGLESKDTGFSCSEMWEVTATATVIVNATASKAEVNAVTAELNYSWDHCHSSMDHVQTIPYLKN